MRIHVLQHVSFEGPAGIADWAARRGHPMTITSLFESEELPDPTGFEWLVVMGGPMGVGDEADYPWLAKEKGLIREAIDTGKTVIGVCLGAQLIAYALGARVYRNAHREIGWLPIELTDQARALGPFASLPHRIQVFHWHGDTFDLPDGAVHLAASEGCEQQAFLYRNRVLGLQFHLESTPVRVADIVASCADEIVPGQYVQDAEHMLATPRKSYVRINQVLFDLLDSLAGQPNRG